MSDYAPVRAGILTADYASIQAHMGQLQVAGGSWSGLSIVVGYSEGNHESFHVVPLEVAFHIKTSDSAAGTFTGDIRVDKRAAFYFINSDGTRAIMVVVHQNTKSWAHLYRADGFVFHKRVMLTYVRDLLVRVDNENLPESYFVMPTQPGTTTSFYKLYSTQRLEESVQGAQSGPSANAMYSTWVDGNQTSIGTGGFGEGRCVSIGGRGATVSIGCPSLVINGDMGTPSTVVFATDVRWEVHGTCHVVLPRAFDDRIRIPVGEITSGDVVLSTDGGYAALHLPSTGFRCLAHVKVAGTASAAGVVELVVSVHPTAVDPSGFRAAVQRASAMTPVTPVGTDSAMWAVDVVVTGIRVTTLVAGGGGGRLSTTSSTVPSSGDSAVLATVSMLTATEPELEISDPGNAGDVKYVYNDTNATVTIKQSNAPQVATWVAPWDDPALEGMTEELLVYVPKRTHAKLLSDGSKWVSV